MNLSKTQKIILGVFTILPFIVTPFVVWQVVHSIIEIVSISEFGEPDPKDIIAIVFSFVTPILFLITASLALLIFYMIHVVLYKKLWLSELLLWIMLFIFFGIIAFPIYWVARIWNNPDNI